VVDRRQKRVGEPRQAPALDIPILVSVRIREKEGQESNLSFHTLVSVNLADVAQQLKLKAGSVKNRVTLSKALAHSLAEHYRPVIEKRGDAEVIRITGKIAPKVFDQLMDILERQGLVVEAEAPKYVKQRMKYWRLAIGAKSDP
jgi:hypothetical protein